jgi:hypothetical protein
VTIQALDQGFVAVQGKHGRSPQVVSADHAVLCGLHHFESHPEEGTPIPFGTLIG